MVPRFSLRNVVRLSQQVNEVHGSQPDVPAGRETQYEGRVSQVVWVPRGRYLLLEGGYFLHLSLGVGWRLLLADAASASSGLPWHHPVRASRLQIKRRSRSRDHRATDSDERAVPRQAPAQRAAQAHRWRCRATARVKPGILRGR